MKLNTKVSTDLDALSHTVLQEIITNLKDAVAKRGKFGIALSGGHTPEKLYSMWAGTDRYRNETPWNLVHIFWGDERYVGPDDPLSNYRMTRETLLSHVPIPEANVHPVPTQLPTPAQTAEAYEGELKKFFGNSAPAFDVTLLGIGPEGHTASLFPNSPALEEKTRWVLPVVAPATPPNRITFTPVVLNQSRNTYFLVAGKDKRPILDAIRAEPDDKVSQFPAARIRPTDGRVIWFLDNAAAQ
ncbi:MAG: 6-phosphogluconolactonase [Candidatus Acidiferrales bacterium]|jgi:6-phosphogluconolactonase